MIAFNFLLIPHAQAAGIQVPLDIDNFASKDYPHWATYCLLQLNRPLTDWDEPCRNAQVIASLPSSTLFEMTYEDFRNAGVEGI